MEKNNYEEEKNHQEELNNYEEELNLKIEKMEEIRIALKKQSRLV